MKTAAKVILTIINTLRHGEPVKWVAVGPKGNSTGEFNPNDYTESDLMLRLFDEIESGEHILPEQAEPDWKPEDLKGMMLYDLFYFEDDHHIFEVALNVCEYFPGSYTIRDIIYDNASKEDVEQIEIRWEAHGHSSLHPALLLKTTWPQVRELHQNFGKHILIVKRRDGHKEWEPAPVSYIPSENPPAFEEFFKPASPSFITSENAHTIHKDVWTFALAFDCDVDTKHPFNF